jgi:hypothetical protein
MRDRHTRLAFVAEFPSLLAAPTYCARAPCLGLGEERSEEREEMTKPMMGIIYSFG